MRLAPTRRCLLPRRERTAPPCLRQDAELERPEAFNIVTPDNAETRYAALALRALDVVGGDNHTVATNRNQASRGGQTLEQDADVTELRHVTLATRQTGDPFQPR